MFMKDYHVHIGQFNELYYDALEIFDVIESTGLISEVHYSSTSTCRNDVELIGIEEEIEYAQKYESNFLKVKPYLWYIPKYAEENISVQSAISSFDYCGIKLHSFAHQWNFQDKKHIKQIEDIFLWAHENKKQILIHCADNQSCLPNKFEKYFKIFSGAKIILAHSNPVFETTQMVNKYDNVFCDTACINKESFEQLKKEINDTKKILFGSDFPINNYWNKLLFNKSRSLSKEYEETCAILKNLNYE